MMDPFRQQMYDNIVEIAIQNGCTVVSKCYVDSKSFMDFLCVNKHPRTSTPKHFKQHPTNCKFCPKNASAITFNNFCKNIEELGGKVIGIYVGCHEGIECLCKNGHTCYPIPSNINKGQGMCKKCAGLCPIEAENNFIKNIEGLGGKVVGEYEGCHTPIKCLCKNNHVCYPIPSKIQQGQGMCKKCANICPEQAKENFVENIKNLGGKVVGEYIDSNTKIECLCKENHTCFVRPDYIKQGHGMCKICVGLCPIEAEKVFRETVDELGGVVIGDYVRSLDGIHCLCELGHDCYPSPAKLQNRGSFCSICTMLSQESYGSKLVSKSLTSLKIEFIREVTPIELLRLKFDFKFEHNNKVSYIEYDGGQHQKYVKKFHKTKDKFELSRQRDLLKNYFIKNSKNCVLIRLDHSWEKNKHLKKQNIVETKLVEYIQSCFLNNNEKIFYNPNIYDWIDGKPNEETINKYLVQ